jgi:hypothetical protein
MPLVPGTQDVKAGGSQVKGQLGQVGETLSQNEMKLILTPEKTCFCSTKIVLSLINFAIIKK